MIVADTGERLNGGVKTSPTEAIDRDPVCRTARVVSFGAAVLVLVVVGLLTRAGGFSGPLARLTLLAGLLLGSGMIADRGPKLRLRDVPSFALDPRHPIGVRAGHVLASCSVVMIIVSAAVGIVI